MINENFRQKVIETTKIKAFMLRLFVHFQLSHRSLSLKYQLNQSSRKTPAESDVNQLLGDTWDQQIKSITARPLALVTAILLTLNFSPASNASAESHLDNNTYLPTTHNNNADKRLLLPLHYQAKYTAKMKGIRVNGIRSIKPIGENRYRADWKIKALWMNIDEWSEFEIDAKNNIRPLKYYYGKKGFSNDKPINIKFNWKEKILISRQGEIEQVYILENNTQDKLSYQIQMQLDLIDKPRPHRLEYNVATEKGLEKYVFQYESEKIVDSKAGKKTSVVFSHNKKNREVKLWLAPDFLYAPIQLLFKKGGSEQFILLTSWQQLGKPHKEPTL